MPRLRVVFVAAVTALMLGGLVVTPSAVATPSVISIVFVGNGSGTVTDGLITCNKTCYPVVEGAVMFVATPAPGSAFTGWSSGCSPPGTNSCIVDPLLNPYAEVSFSLVPQETIAVAKAGNGIGTVTSSDGLINCGTTCSRSYDYGSSVTLNATPSVGATFTGWSGACSGTGACTVTTNDATSVTATFSLIPEQLTVTRKGDGAGTVISSPLGINCGTTCSRAYAYGIAVSLSALAAKHSSFAGWSGACGGKGACSLSMKAAQSVRATFLKDCLVPKLTNKSLRKARLALSAHDCSVGKITHVTSPTVKRGDVVSEKPRPGKLLAHDAKVSLVVSAGQP